VPEDGVPVDGCGVLVDGCGVLVTAATAAGVTDEPEPTAAVAAAAAEVTAPLPVVELCELVASTR
jgi:hypothetical protein